MKNAWLWLRKWVIIAFCSITCMFSSCYFFSISPQMREYYKHKDNYVIATGVISYIKEDKNAETLYLSFSDLEPKFDDDTFKVVGDNFRIVRENDFDQKVKVGDMITFMTAPKYFGDGYVMPIVALTVNEEKLLDFETGYNNLQNWLKE